MKYCFCLFIVIVSLASCKKNAESNGFNANDTIITVMAPQAVSKTNAQKIFMHYMPWFDDKNTSGSGRWGLHWTMTNQNPDIILPNGQRQIAAFFYPLIGPYASSDKDVIDYHLLLMKYSGVDGTIVDWYGTHNVADYPLVKRNTDSLFNNTPATGLEFSICYEDATLKTVKRLAGIDSITAARTDLTYLQNNYFEKDHYTKINSQPLLLNFGPQTLKTNAGWQQVFSVLPVKPRLLSIAFQGAVIGEAGSGEFAWITPEGIASTLNFYQYRAPYILTAFSGAFPGFKDFSYAGGWRTTDRQVYEYNGTNTLVESLQEAKNTNLPYIQLITWNDFGEGTMLEPSVEFGFSFLEKIQTYTGVTYSITELQLIYNWYLLRKKYKDNSNIQKRLTRAYYYLVSLDVEKAKAVISAIE